jgi:hypothetical protein
MEGRRAVAMIGLVMLDFRCVPPDLKDVVIFIVIAAIIVVPMFFGDEPD